jgi:DNA mismatch repair ATPase MutS
MSLTNEDKEWIAGKIDAAMQYVTAGLEQTNARIEQTNARIEQVETALLTEFHKWASPAEMRARTHAAAIRAIDAEIEFLSDRVTKLEGKPPQGPAQ